MTDPLRFLVQLLEMNLWKSPTFRCLTILLIALIEACNVTCLVLDANNFHQYISYILISQPGIISTVTTICFSNKLDGILRPSTQNFWSLENASKPVLGKSKALNTFVAALTLAVTGGYLILHLPLTGDETRINPLVMVPDNHFNHLLSKLFSAVMYLYCPVFALGLVYPFLLVMYLIAVASFQLDLLREEISTLYDCRHQELVHKKLVSCIQHHVRLLNFRNTWVKHSRLTMLCIPVSSLAPVGAGYFLINQVSPSSNFRMVLVLVIFVVSVTALCFTGQHFQDSFGNIFDAACQCPWFDWGKENKRVLMMLLMNSAKPVEISSYTTIALNLRLLMIFHKCIYSLITLLQ